METKIIDKLYLKLSQVTKAKTEKEIKMQKVICLLSSMIDGGEHHSDQSRKMIREVLD